MLAVVVAVGRPGAHQLVDRLVLDDGGACSSPESSWSRSGVVAEYVGVAVNMAMGKPSYIVVTDRATGPLGRPKEQTDTGP